MARGHRAAASALACGLALACLARAASADEEEREAFPMPVVRTSLGFVSSAPMEEAGLLGELDVGVHVHWSYLFFGGELGWAASETEKLLPTQFFQVGAPIGVTTEEAILGLAFVPRLLIGGRESHDVVAMRLGGAAYGLGGTFSFELAQERWLGDGGGTHLVGAFGVDFGRLIFLVIDDDDLDKIR